MGPKGHGVAESGRSGVSVEEGGVVSGGDQGRILGRGGIWKLVLERLLWLRHSRWQEQLSKGRKAGESDFIHSFIHSFNSITEFLLHAGHCAGHFGYKSKEEIYILPSRSSFW